MLGRDSTTRSRSSDPKSRRRILACCRGATAVEFAIVAPLFLTMMIGVFELSRAMWIKATMQFAVEETARYAIVNNTATTATLVAYAQTTLTGTGMSSTGITFTATSDTTGSNNYMTISASFNFEPLVSLVQIPAVTLTAKSRVPIS